MIDKKNFVFKIEEKEQNKKWKFNVIKNSQMIVIAVSLMLIAASYFNYNNRLR